MKKHKTVVIFGAPVIGKTYFINYWSHIFKILDADFDFFNNNELEFSAGQSVAFDDFDIIFVPKSVEILKKFDGFRCFWSIGSCSISLFSSFCSVISYGRNVVFVCSYKFKGVNFYNSYVSFSGSSNCVFDFIISLIKKQQF